MLDATPKEMKSRSALTVNPAKTCQPIGAMYAALGIHGCLPHSHGSQGCCSYHRSHLTRHYREPVMASTSSFTEGSAVFGGQPNLRQALKTIFQVYDPDVVAVHTTCLSETIGDDLTSILAKAREEGLVPEGKHVLHTNTPSYVGSHVTGFANMVRSMCEYFAQPGEKGVHINVLPGYVDPGDMRHLKRILSEMGVDFVLAPDTSDVLDAPQTGHFTMYPPGGAKVEDLKRMGTAKATVSLGNFASEPAAASLETRYGVHPVSLDLPIGVKATDRFLSTVMDLTGASIPKGVLDDRGRLVDMMTDMQNYLYGKRVAIMGDPDHLVALAEFLASAGMKTVYAVTGTPGKRFELRMKGILKETSPQAVIKAGGDQFLMHQLIKNDPVDLIIGNTYGKLISRAEGIPLVRFGFPIMDRVGHNYFPVVGYRGGMHLLTSIINTILEEKDRTSPEEGFELVL